MTGRRYDIFISYRREGGKDYARVIKPELEKRGFRVFLDFDELKDGKFDQRILDAIEDAPIFMLILSKGCLDRCVNDDDWVRQEIIHADKASKHIVPVELDKSFRQMPESVPDDVKTIVSQHQYSQVDTETLLQASMDELVRYRIQPYITVVAPETEGAEIHIESDADCSILRFQREIGRAVAGEDTVVHLKKGKHKLEFVSLQVASVRQSVVVEVPDNDYSDFVEVSLRDGVDSFLKAEREEAERKAKEEAERKAKEEAERKAKEEAERKAKEEAERKAKEEAERKAKEETERKAKEEAERKAKEEAERNRMLSEIVGALSICASKRETEQKALEESLRKHEEETKDKVRKETTPNATSKTKRKASTKQIHTPKTDADYKALGYTIVGAGKTTLLKKEVQIGAVVKHVKVADSVTVIEKEALGYKQLYEIVVPDTVAEIGAAAFGLVKNVVYHGKAVGAPWGALTVNGYVENGFVYPSETKSEITGYVGKSAKVVIPDSVENIGSFSFSRCYSMESVVIPSKVKSIDSFAFGNCKNLEQVTFQKDSNLGVIGYKAFCDCFKLEEIVIPASVVNIGEGAFEGCVNLKKVILKNPKTKYKKSSGLLSTRSFPKHTIIIKA